VLYKDEYTSGNDVRIDPSIRTRLRDALAAAAELHRGRRFGGAGNGIFKSTDGGTTWKQLTDGLPSVIQANIALAPSNPKLLYAIAARRGAARRRGARGDDRRRRLLQVDGRGEHWSARRSARRRGAPRAPAIRVRSAHRRRRSADARRRSARTRTSSTAARRVVAHGRRRLTWTAVRGAPGGDDYQKIWINPNEPNILLVVADQGACLGNRGCRGATGTRSRRRDVPRDRRQRVPVRVCGGQQDSGSACVDSRSMDGEITFHDWHPVNIQEYGIAAPDPKIRTWCTAARAPTCRSTTAHRTDDERRAERRQRGRTSDATCARCRSVVAGRSDTAVLRVERRVEVDDARTAGRASAATSRGRRGRSAERRQVREHVTPAPQGSITALSPSPRDSNVIWAERTDGNIQGDDGRRRDVEERDAAADHSRGRASSTSRRALTTTTRPYAGREHPAVDDLNPHFWRTHDGGRRGPEINTGIAPGNVANSIREDPRKRGPALRRDRRAGLGFVRRRRPLALARATTCRASRCATSR
jgi:hypothetical protein